MFLMLLDFQLQKIFEGYVRTLEFQLRGRWNRNIRIFLSNQGPEENDKEIENWRGKLKDGKEEIKEGEERKRKIKLANIFLVFFPNREKKWRTKEEKKKRLFSLLFFLFFFVLLFFVLSLFLFFVFFFSPFLLFLVFIF